MLVVGIIVGFIAMAFLSFIPILGPILAGFIAGIIAGGGAVRGLLAGFLSGIFGALVAWFILGSLGTVFGGPMGALAASIIGAGLVILSLYTAFLGLIGGAIGGALRPKKQK